MTEPKDPRELLALLTNKVQHFAISDGGVPVYTSDDVAFILAKVKNPNARLYARIKYADQREFMDELAHDMRRATITIEGIGKWRVPRKDWLLDICRLALCDDVNPNVCHICKGRGHALIKSKHVDCGFCNGSGRQPLRDYQKAELMGCSKSSWSDPWADRFIQIQRHTVFAWDQIVAGVIRVQKAEQNSPSPNLQTQYL